MEVQSCYLSTWEEEKEGADFTVRLGYTGHNVSWRLSSENKQPTWVKDQEPLNPLKRQVVVELKVNLSEYQANL